MKKSLIIYSKKCVMQKSQQNLLGSLIHLNTGKYLLNKN